MSVALPRLPAETRRQLGAHLGYEIRRRLRGARAVVLLMMAAGPVALFAARAALMILTGRHDDAGAAVSGYAVVYQILILRLTVFFGCVLVFTSLLRGELLDRTLHYHFLAPVPRWVLAAGKFGSGLVVTIPLFGAATAATWLLVWAPYGADVLRAQALSPTGWVQLGSYLATTALACVGYGAVFFTTGIFFRTPIGPTLAILVWENLLIFLPSVLKKISIIHYLESLLPVPLPAEGPFQILSVPSSPWLAVPGILAVSGILLACAVRRLRAMEVHYGAD